MYCEHVVYIRSLLSRPLEVRETLLAYPSVVEHEVNKGLQDNNGDTTLQLTSVGVTMSKRKKQHDSIFIDKKLDIKLRLRKYMSYKHFYLAPCSRSSSTTSSCPPSAASSNVVLPNLSFACTSAPYSRSRRTTSSAMGPPEPILHIYICTML